MAIVFWLGLLLMVYIYAGYPMLARRLAAGAKRGVASAPIRPAVTVVVAAYNEEKSIRAKLDNLMSVDYPQELLDVMVASDASDDATDDIVRRYPSDRVRLFRVEGRRGKTYCQNMAVHEAKGEIVVFTDATTQLDSGAVIALVENFADPEIGCVAGRLVYVDTQNSLTGQGGTAYWEYELALREAESSLGSLVGVSGCLYAVRKSAYRDMDPAIISDFVIAMVMRGQGLRTVLAPNATCREETLTKPDQELGMRVRVALRSITALAAERRFLNPFRFGVFAWQLWSHKVLRYASPLIWAVLLIASVWLSGHWFYALAFWAQLALIAMGLLGWLVHGRGTGPLLKPYYFLLTNAASLVAIFRFLLGERVTVWKTVR